MGDFMFYTPKTLDNIKQEIEKLVSARKTLIAEVQTFLSDSESRIEMRYANNWRIPFYINYRNEMIGYDPTELIDLKEKKPRSKYSVEFSIIDGKVRLARTLYNGEYCGDTAFIYKNNSVIKICYGVKSEVTNYIEKIVYDNGVITDILHIRFDRDVFHPPLMAFNEIITLENAFLKADCDHFVYENGMIVHIDSFNNYIYPYNFNFYDDEQYRDYKNKRIYLDFPHLNPDGIAEYKMIYENGFAVRFTRKNYVIFDRIIEHTWKVPKRVVNKFNDHDIFVFGKIPNNDCDFIIKG
jgi:hypothetical protein